VPRDFVPPQLRADQVPSLFDRVRLTPEPPVASFPRSWEERRTELARSHAGRLYSPGPPGAQDSLGPAGAPVAPVIDLSVPRPAPVTARGRGRRLRILATLAALGAVLTGGAGYAAARGLGLTGPAPHTAAAATPATPSAAPITPHEAPSVPDRVDAAPAPAARKISPAATRRTGHPYHGHGHGHGHRADRAARPATRPGGVRTARR
jgi:hypothetical protein